MFGEVNRVMSLQILIRKWWYKMANGTGYGIISSTAILDKIRLYLQIALEPVLTEAELAQIYEMAKRVDNSGLIPSDAAWTETIDTDWAIAEGWKIKAAKVTGSYQFKDEGLELHREQIITNCLLMAKEWKSKTAGTLPSQNVFAAGRRAIWPNESQI